MSGRHSRRHELTTCQSIQSVLLCHHQAIIELMQIVLNRSQPGLPRSTSFTSPVFGKTLKCRPEELKNILSWCRTTKVVEERQAPSTDSIWQEWLTHMRPNHIIIDKIHPVDMENMSEFRDHLGGWRLMPTKRSRWWHARLKLLV